MIAKNNEEKRNQIWRTVMAVSTVLIIIIAAFFVVVSCSRPILWKEHGTIRTAALL